MKTLHPLTLTARALTTVLTGALALALAAAPRTATAGSDSKLSVTATILKQASLKVLAQPSSLVVTALDIARGYVEVPSPAQIAIRSNSSRGYMLVFASQGELVRQTRVRGLGAEVQLSSGGGVVTQVGAASGITQAVLDLGFRFELSESAQQGIHAWPLQLSVVPL